MAARGPSRSRLSPDGTLLAEGRQGLWLGGNDVEVRSTASGKVAFTLKGHTWRVVDIVFSPDGSRIATASDDRTVKLWDTTTGQAVLTLRGHTQAVTCVAFSPDGRRLVSGAVDVPRLGCSTSFRLHPHRSESAPVGPLPAHRVAPEE